MHARTHTHTLLKSHTDQHVFFPILIVLHNMNNWWNSINVQNPLTKVSYWANLKTYENGYILAWKHTEISWHHNNYYKSLIHSMSLFRQAKLHNPSRWITEYWLKSCITSSIDTTESHATHHMVGMIMQWYLPLLTINIVLARDCMTLYKQCVWDLLTYTTPSAVR